jgi:hypothetical protein
VHRGVLSKGLQDGFVPLTAVEGPGGRIEIRDGGERDGEIGTASGEGRPGGQPEVGMGAEEEALEVAPPDTPADRVLHPDDGVA